MPVFLQSSFDDTQIGVIETIFVESPALEASDHFVHVEAGQVKDGLHVASGLEDLGLVRISRDSVQDQGVILRVEALING